MKFINHKLKDTVQRRKRKTPALEKKVRKLRILDSKSSEEDSDHSQQFTTEMSSFDQYKPPEQQFEETIEYYGYSSDVKESSQPLQNDKQSASEGFVCVPPGEVGSGIREYVCSNDNCKHLRFTSWDGPSGVKEHNKLCH